MYKGYNASVVWQHIIPIKILIYHNCYKKKKKKKATQKSLPFGKWMFRGKEVRRMGQKQKKIRQKEQQHQAEELKRMYTQMGSNWQPWDSRQGGDTRNHRPPFERSSAMKEGKINLRGQVACAEKAFILANTRRQQCPETALRLETCVAPLN